MVHFATSQATEFTAEQMFALVNDVAAYSQFLPGCTKSVVLTTTPQEITAELTLSAGPITQEFATKNTLSYPTQIRMTKLSGPFKKLDGMWEFQQLTHGSLISLKLEYEFNNKMLALMLNRAFSSLTKSMVSAFITRAQQIYL